MLPMAILSCVQQSDIHCCNISCFNLARQFKQYREQRQKRNSQNFHYVNHICHTRAIFNECHNTFTFSSTIISNKLSIVFCASLKFANFKFSNKSLLVTLENSQFNEFVCFLCEHS